MSRSRGRRNCSATDRTWVATHYPDLERYALELSVELSVDKVPWTLIAKRLKVIHKFLHTPVDKPVCGLEQLTWGNADLYNNVRSICLQHAV